MENEIMYKRELNHSYMVLKCRDGSILESYACRTIVENQIGRLLPCSLRQMDGEAFLYYDISSRQPLGRLYEAGKLGVFELERIFKNIIAMQEDLGEYLLDEQGLLLDTEMLFADMETEELYFAFDPEKTDPANRYAKLADFLLENVDHSREHAVNIAYQFYKLSKAEYFVLTSFLPFLEKETTAAKKESAGMEMGRLPEKLPEDFPGAFWGSGEEWDSGDAVEDPNPDSEQQEGQKRETGQKAGKKRKQGFGSKSGQDKRTGLFARLFGRRQEKNKAKETEAEEWPETIWDSYAGQVDFADSGETVYFADLDKPGKKKGIPILRREDGGSLFPLDNLPATVGKLKGRVRICLSDSSVSRLHARFETEDDGICVRDLNSRNGTIVNDRKLAPNEATALSDGDIIRFGRECFVLEWK